MSRYLVPSLACALLGVAILGFPPSSESPARAAPAAAQPAGEEVSPPQQAFDRLSSLVGLWETEEKAYDGYKIRLSYSLVSNGRALLETFRLGYTEHEMVTIYHLDNDGLGMHHFCEVGNQVRLHAKLGESDDEITFEYVDGTNLQVSSAQIIDRLSISFHDENHFTQDWRWKLDNVDQPYQYAEYTFTRLEDGPVTQEVNEYGSDR